MVYGVARAEKTDTILWVVTRTACNDVSGALPGAGPLVASCSRRIRSSKALTSPSPTPWMGGIRPPLNDQCPRAVGDSACLRDELLEAELIRSLADAKALTGRWKMTATSVGHTCRLGL